MNIRRILPLLLTILCLSARAQQVPPVREKLHLYLLMGQSNMAGRDRSKLAGQVDNPRVLAFSQEGKWSVARDPLHQKDGRIEPGAGPGISFANAMAKAQPGVTIGLIPCAVGGTPLKRWVKGGDLYQRAIERAKAAEKDGVIMGVLWHQGESDSGKEELAVSYEKRLSGMIADLRGDLGKPELPVVVGEIGGFLDLKKNPYAETVRAALKRIPAEVPRTGFASSEGLGDKGDKLHFSADAAKTLGERYAEVMLSTGKTAVRANKQAPSIGIWPDGGMPGKGAREPETNARPERTDATRITNVSRPTLTLFPAPQKNSPTLIVCPGGGYSYVVVDKEGSEVAAWLNANGYGALVLKYRVPNNRAGALQDVQRALSLARVNAADWNIDPKRLGIIGFSAGGNLAAKSSTLFDTRSYPAIDAVDQQSCRPDFAVLVYPAYLDDKAGHVSPDLDLGSNIPPTLIVHSEDDKPFVPGSKLYAAALKEAEIPHEFLLYPTGGHGYALRCERDAKTWPRDAMEWLGKTLPQTK